MKTNNEVKKICVEKLKELIHSIETDETCDNYCYTFDIVGFAGDDTVQIRDVVYSFKRTEYYEIK